MAGVAQGCGASWKERALQTGATPKHGCELACPFLANDAPRQYHVIPKILLVLSSGSHLLLHSVSTWLRCPRNTRLCPSPPRNCLLETYSIEVDRASQTALVPGFSFLLHVVPHTWFPEPLLREVLYGGTGQRLRSMGTCTPLFDFFHRLHNGSLAAESSCIATRMDWDYSKYARDYRRSKLCC